MSNFSEGESRYNNLTDTRCAYDSDDNMLAEGVAPIGSLTDQSVWTVRRKWYDEKGRVIRTTMRKNMKWDEWEDIA
jgi:hypothetical protein